MNLAVPTLYCKAILAHSVTLGLKTWAVGEIIELPYGQALVLKAGGCVGSFVDEADVHLQAQEQLAIYGADCWFPTKQQTISKVADYLKVVEETPGTKH